jgi:hypothetical protein
MAEEESHVRVGSNADLSRRVERLEGQMSVLSLTVERVEANQNHAEELNKLRFDGLDRSLTGLAGEVKAWMTRMEGVFTGEVQTAASRDLKAAKEQAEREGALVMGEYMKWRGEISNTVDVLVDKAEKNEAVALALIESRKSTGTWVRMFLPFIIAALALVLAVVNTVTRLG